MPYITREDGEHFVIPSYRDVLTAKNKNQLKREILLLSQSYGEYITLQKKGASQYEIAFSPDTGYLLGESVWHFFKRPLDLIYCETIPNSTEALLVIVKNGSVYLDGSFPLESIPEELVIFLTQQNHFEIYIYGDVPLSQTPAEGKFSFAASAVKSFNVLEKPIFPTLPLLKVYQLQLVDPVLRANGIGVFPLSQLLSVAIIAGLIWFGYKYIVAKPTVAPTQVAAINPYQGYLTALATPAPDKEINAILRAINLLYSMPGWQPEKGTYTQKKLITSVKSIGGTVENLLKWAALNEIQSEITPTGINMIISINLPNRPQPQKIYSVQAITANFVDNLAKVYPGNHLKIGEITSKGRYTYMTFILDVQPLSSAVIALIADQVKDLPFILQKFDFETNNGNLQGSIIFEALGS